MFKNKLNNYFAAEIFKSYIFILLVLSLLIWVMQSARLLYLITDIGISLKVYFQYIFLLFPKIISQLMLLSLVVSLFMSIIKLQTNRELEIYWLSGISKNKLIKIIIKFSIFLTFISLILHLLIVPYSNGKSRDLIVNSEFSFINSLVKPKNFNSPLRNLTLYVNKNDNKGNLEKIYIFENNKTIISKKGRVLNIDEKNYLELENGVIHEKDSNNNIKTISFDKTLYDFTKYQRNLITKPKLQEQKSLTIFNEYIASKNSNTLYEIHKRIFKPLFIPILAILCCFIFYNNAEKTNTNRQKIFIFIISTLLIIFFEILLNLSVLFFFFKVFLYCFPFLGSIFLLLYLNNFLKKENFI